MASTWNKKEREKKKQQNRKEKEEKRLERKENAKKGQSLDDMMAYLDENGNISSTPDPRKKITINVEDIEIGVPKQREIDPSELIRKGVVTFFNQEKGYGFIKDLETQESIFVHINSSADELKENSKVVFEVEKGPRGLNAINVKLGS